jgi:hypothetical protein
LRLWVRSSLSSSAIKPARESSCRAIEFAVVRLLALV